MNDLRNRLSALADDITDTDYTTLRERVGSTSRRLGRRKAAASVLAVALVGVAAFGGIQLAGTTASHQTGTPPGRPACRTRRRTPPRR